MTCSSICETCSWYVLLPSGNQQAPLLEEILYRGSIMTFLLHSGYSLLQSILISSVAFGSCCNSD